jgi:L-threonylcarbamoyladenylate synthase
LNRDLETITEYVRLVTGTYEKSGRLISLRNIEAAGEIIRRQGIIGYPTETVYGLGGAVLDQVAERIQRIKKRDRKPMLILIPDSDSLSLLVRGIGEGVWPLINAFWPGPLTLVFQARSGPPGQLIGPDGGIAVRRSPDPVCQQLLALVGQSIISTSANVSGHPPARTAQQVREYFGSQIDGVLDGGPRNTSEVSTVLDVRSCPFKLLREGAVSRSSLVDVAGDCFD